MEASLHNFLSPGDEVVACCNGKFGQMWAGFAERAELRVHRLEESWDRSVDGDAVAEALAAHPEARAVLVCHSDTSTGVLNPVADIASATHAHDALVMVDGISSVGGVPFEFDAWDIDFAVTSSQKCLMSSPGVSFGAVGKRAWQAAERSRGTPPAYFDFRAIRDVVCTERPETPGTTPVSLMLQVREALRVMEADGDPRAQSRRTPRLAERLRRWAAEVGFTLQGGEGLLERSPTLTALLPPEELDAASLRAGVLEQGILIAGGLGPYRGRSIRIAHMGDISMEDVERTIAALADVMGVPASA